MALDAAAAVLADTIPAGRDGDAYVFRLVLHDWDDASTVRILRAVLKAAGSAAITLLIIEVATLLRPHQDVTLSQLV